MDDKTQGQPAPKPDPDKAPDRLSETELMESGANLDEGQIEADGPRPK